MNTLQMMPTSIWALASATIIMIVLITLVLNLYYRKRLQAIGPLNTDLGDLVNQKQQLETDIDSIRDWIASQNDEILRLKAEREEQEITRAELLRLEQEASQKEEDNKKLRDEVGALENQRHLLVQSMEKVEDEKIGLKKEIESLGKEKDKALSDLKEAEINLKKEKEKLEADLKDIENQIEETRKAESDLLETLKKAEQQVTEFKTELQSVKDDIKAAEKDLKQLEQQLDSKERDIKDLDRVQRSKEREVESLQERKIDLDARVETLSDKLKTIGQMPKEAFDSLNHPVFTKNENVRAKVSEAEGLKKLYQVTEDSGYELPERLQNAFHTSLKTSDISCLTVMAGVSGTGKSAFPKLYAQSMGIHFLPLAVEPRWDSPQDLFGFLNYMENRFETTTLGRSLVQFNNSPFANDHADMQDQLLIVLLDEMNLARIEYYFSEFLSKLEMRRNIDINHEADYRMVSTEIYSGGREDKDLGFEKSDPLFLYAGKNVLFVGTMNEDETTQSLSDKVIDRANVLYFGKPDKLKNQKQTIVPYDNWAPISYDNWLSWYREPDSRNIPEFEKIDTLLNDLNSTLAELGRPFGWRTYRAIMTYIANHPAVTINGSDSMQPVADQVAMRVMPKLRGLDLAEYESVFTRLRGQLQQINDEPLMEAFVKASQSAQGFFDWRGIKW
jgi:predicted  nucleic acid-binding Zn-ribbon protein